MDRIDHVPDDEILPEHSLQGGVRSKYAERYAHRLQEKTLPFEPQDPDFEARVRESFRRQRVMETLGARLVRVAAGEVEVELPFREELTQQHGFLHAGIVTTVLDSACGYAAFSLMPADAAVLSIEFKTNLLAPARGDRLLARGRVVRAGRNVTVCQADGVMTSPEGERHVATMLATMMTVRGREGLAG